MAYYVGQRLTIKVAFRNAAGTLFDPSKVRVTYRLPGANRRRSSVIRKTFGIMGGVDRVSTGEYAVTLRPTEPGDLEIVWESYGEGEETLASVKIPIVLQPEIVRTFTGTRTDDNRFTGPTTDDNRFTGPTTDDNR